MHSKLGSGSHHKPPSRYSHRSPSHRRSHSRSSSYRKRTHSPKARTDEARPDPSLRQELQELKRLIAGVLPPQAAGNLPATPPPTTFGDPDPSPYLRGFSIKPSSSVKTFYTQASFWGEPPAFPLPLLDLSVQVGDHHPPRRIPRPQLGLTSRGNLCPDVPSPVILNEIALDDYVDFCPLVPDPTQKPSYNVSFELGTRTVCNLLPKKRKPLTKGEWSRASGSSLLRTPNTSPRWMRNFFLYQNHILELMEVPGFDWAYLDFKLRYEKKQLQHGWRHIHQHLETKISRGMTQLISTLEEGGTNKQSSRGSPPRAMGSPWDTASTTTPKENPAPTKSPASTLSCATDASKHPWLSGPPGSLALLPASPLASTGRTVLPTPLKIHPLKR